MDEEMLCGERPLQPDEVKFVYSVHRQGELLQFTMEKAIDTEEVFGLKPGRDNDCAAFACYDLKRGEVCDTLDVKVYEDDGSKEYYEYRLRPEEKALLLSRMNPYCLEKTGMRLEAHRERFQLEQDGLLPDPRGERWDAMKTFQRQKRLAESRAGERASDNEKYQITAIAHPEFPNLHRILALRDIGTEVKAGDLGGYVESEDNLSYEAGDDAWVYDDARVSDTAHVCEGSQVRNHAAVSGHACVAKSSLICGDAAVSDQAEVYGALLRDCAEARGNSVLTRSPETHLAPTLMGNCEVYGNVEGFVRISGTMVIRPDEKVMNQEEKPLTFNDRTPAKNRRTSKIRKEKRTPSL